MHTLFWHHCTPEHQAIVFLELFYEPKCRVSHKLVPPDHSSGENPLVARGGKKCFCKGALWAKTTEFCKASLSSELHFYTSVLWETLSRIRVMNIIKCSNSLTLLWQLSLWVNHKHKQNPYGSQKKKSGVSCGCWMSRWRPAWQRTTGKYRRWRKKNEGNVFFYFSLFFWQWKCKTFCSKKNEV